MLNRGKGCCNLLVMLLTQPKVPLNFFLTSAGLLAHGQLDGHQDHPALFCKAALQLGSVKGWMIKTELKVFTHGRVYSPQIANEHSVQNKYFTFPIAPDPDGLGKNGPSLLTHSQLW